VSIAYLFWAAFALVTPVTVFDANTYNLARLPVAARAGLFGNQLWNSSRQACLPWTFDAVHLPILAIGWGFALPSFACFTGILVIVFRLLKQQYDEDTAWLGSAVLLGLPTLMYQATSVKNDIPVVFCALLWYYAWRYFKSESRRRYLALMALALAFAAGAKTSGLPVAAVLGGCSVWNLRFRRKARWYFAACLLVALLGWGSVEIYIDNVRLYGHPMGPSDYIYSLSNHAGLRGALANFVRYMAGLTDVGLSSTFLSEAAQWVVRHIGCANAGLMPNQTEAEVRILNDGWEASSSFGPLGALSIWYSFLIGIVSKNRLARRLSLSALAAIGVVCLTTNWMPWNNRFLMLPVVLGSIALTVAVASKQSDVGRGALLVLAVWSGVIWPIHSLNKNPRGLVDSIRHRQDFAFKERPTMEPVIRDIQDRANHGQLRQLTVCAGSDSWLLPFFSVKDLRVELQPDAERLPLVPGRYVMFLDRAPEGEMASHLEIIERYPEPDTALYRIRRS
jgi:hypothetical protein